MRRERGCLTTLDATTRELLGLRAGLDGPPASRGHAATQLGLTRRQAARLERDGLRNLHAACGSSGTGGGAPAAAPASVAALAGSAPALQPAGYLPIASAPTLRPAVDMNGKRGKQAVKGASASSSPPSSTGSGSGSARVTTEAAAVGGQQDSGKAGLWIAVSAMIAALVALLLVGLRRRAVAMQRGRVSRPPVQLDTPVPAPTVTQTAANTAVPAAPAAAPPAPVQAEEQPKPPPVTSAPAAPVATTRMRPRDPRRLASIAARQLKKRRGR